MKLSTYLLERNLGMRYYASDTEGIGGKLRSTPEDFVVEEIPLEDKGGSTGPYLICTLTKKNWELQHAIKEIAKRLGISHRRIGWAGTKDRNAVTRQRISIYNVTPEQVKAIRLKDITLEPVGFANTMILLGDLQGNCFDITIRDAVRDHLEETVLKVTGVVSDAVPNYFGLQRFGAIRPVTHTVGEWILRGDYEQAVVTYVGMAFPGEADPIRDIRSSFVATRDPVPALQNLPPQMSYERAMLHHLHTHPGDYAGSLHELPPKLLSMFVSAYQSYLFNCALSQRFDQGYGLTEPVPGDPLIFTNGRVDTVTLENRKAASLHIARGRCNIAIFMPGSEPLKGILDGTMAELLAAQHITAKDFGQAAKFVRTKFEGAWRPIALKTHVEATVDNTAVRLKFILPPGHYATTVCREYMKADPVKMV